jgi:uncharacterized protein (DUF169 family)
MTTLKDYNRYGENLERLLLLNTSPIAVKMLKKEEDIPERALRPKRDRSYHLAQCQAFAMSRRERATVAMLKEDNWCPAPLIAYGLVPFPDDPVARKQNTYDCFEYGRYIGILSAPLRTAVFEPDVVIIYADTNQLRNLLLAMKLEDRPLVSGHFSPPSCAYAVTTPVMSNEYRVVLPDPGEHVRALTTAGEIMFSVPKDKLRELLSDLARYYEESHFAHENMIMRPDFPQPELYKRVFEDWGMEHD